MNATQSDTTFNRSIYRDFALFALAAVGVGLAISLTLATAVVLTAPDGDRTTQSVHSAAGPQRTQVARNGMGSHSLQHLLPTAPVPERAPG